MSKGKVRKPTKKEMAKLEHLDLSNLPALRFRVKALTGELVQIGSFVLENINISQLVFLRMPAGSNKDDLVQLADSRIALEKYNVDKQFIVYLSSEVEVLELEPIAEEEV
jgi:hypothetical protein